MLIVLFGIVLGKCLRFVKLFPISETFSATKVKVFCTSPDTLSLTKLMWDDISSISGLPPFQVSGDADVASKLNSAKIELADKLAQLDFVRTELHNAKTDHAE